MKLVDLKVIDFIKEVDSASPAPGGGSVSALSSSLGASLARMVGHLTVNKKKYAELSNDIKNKFEDSFNKLSVINEELIKLIDEDTENFNNLMTAMKMPKESDEEKLLRKKKMKEAAIQATNTPLKILELSLKILRELHIFIEHGNKNALSDVGVAALLAEAGGKGAILNVKINISSIEDENIILDFKAKCAEGLAEIDTISKSIKNKIDALL